MRATFTLHFNKGYIADPYWPEIEELINIQKESGMNRVRSSGARQKALNEHLASRGMSLEDYRVLEESTKRPFYTDDDGMIVIPEQQVSGMLVQAAAKAPATIRICSDESLRAYLDVGKHWPTGKAEPDGIWKRFAVATSGTGAKLSNQRSLRENAFVEDFDVEGSAIFDESSIKYDVLGDFLGFAGREIGIGASRKMGWGRFTVEDFAFD